MSTLFYEEDLAFHRALVRANEAQRTMTDTPSDPIGRIPLKRSEIRAAIEALLKQGITLDDLQEALNQMRADKPLIEDDKS